MIGSNATLKRLRISLYFILQFVALGTALIAIVWAVNGMEAHRDISPSELPLQNVTLWTDALPFALLLLALLAWTRKIVLSTWLSGLAAGLLYGVNALKSDVLARPLSHDDFMLLSEFGDGMELLLRYVPWDRHFVARLAAFLAITLAIAVFEPRCWRRASMWARATTTCVALALLTSLISGWSPWRVVYARDHIDFKPWEASSDNSARIGLVNTLLMQGLYAPSEDALVTDPEPGRELLDNWQQPMAEYMSQPLPASLPDIVIVQSESFFDPTIMRGIDGERTPNLRRLQRSGLHGDLHVPAYGGGTIQTEFEILTGLPLRFFPQLQYPYLGIKEASIPGLVQSLKAAGYDTLAIHPNKGGFWNRNSVFRRMDFDRFIDITDPAFQSAQRIGFYISDHDLTNVILDTLPTSGPPQFTFAISIQAHGPYANIKFDEARSKQRDAIPIPSGLDKATARALRNYLIQLRDADRELGRLADALAKRQRPTLLVFYGDHLPGLEKAYAKGFKNELKPFEQRVPYLMLHFPKDSQPPRRQDLSAWTVAASILDDIGIHNDVWFTLQNLVIQTTPTGEPALNDEDMHRLASLAGLRLKNRIDNASPKFEQPRNSQSDDNQTTHVPSAPDHMGQ